MPNGFIAMSCPMGEKINKYKIDGTLVDVKQVFCGFPTGVDLMPMK